MFRSPETTKATRSIVANVTTSFPYPDPRKVKGGPSFLVRLAEMAKLEAETVRSEQAKARLMLSVRSRPSNAKNVKSSATACTGAHLKQHSNTCQQSNRRMSSTVSRAPPAALRRLNSSPAVSTVTSSTVGPSSSLTISKQLSCTNLPNRAQLRDEVCGELNTATVSSVQEKTKAKLNTATTSHRGTTVGESKVQKEHIPNIVEEGLGDGCKVQRSCSPPIVYIPAPPFKCSLILGEKSEDVATLDRHGENVLAEVKGKSIDHENESGDTAKEDTPPTVLDSNTDSVTSCKCQNGRNSAGDLRELEAVDSNSGPASCQENVHTCTNGHGATLEDDLKVTSDLGLSVDSLHLSEEDSPAESAVTTPAPAPDVSPSVKADLNFATFDNGTSVENGYSAWSRSSADPDSKIPVFGVDKLADLNVDVASEKGGVTKRAVLTKKKSDKKSSKLTNGSSAPSQTVSSNLSTSCLKGVGKTVRNSHKTMKRTTKKRVKK